MRERAIVVCRSDFVDYWQLTINYELTQNGD